MRTTLDIDDTVLAIARAKAHAEGISIGRAVSDLAMQGLRPSPAAEENGFPTFDPVEGHLITDELVDRYRDDA